MAHLASTFCSFHFSLFAYSFVNWIPFSLVRFQLLVDKELKRRAMLGTTSYENLLDKLENF